MSFFTNFTTMNITGLALLVAGALINFLAARIARLFKSDNIIITVLIKVVGLVLVIIAFLMVIGIIA